VLRLTDPDTKRLADNSNVIDHYALLPTRQISRKAMDGLDEMERNLMTLVLQRLLCAASKPYLYEETILTLECCGTTFTAKGKRVVDAGWKTLEGAEESESASLPALEEGQVLHNLTASRSDHKTTPPKQHTEDTLLSAMEHAANGEFAEDVERSGLGTPATRAGILEKLVSSGYVVRKGKQLVPTEAGKLLVSLLPEKLKSPAMTAQWENDLLRIQRGEVSPRDFMHGIEDLTLEIIGQEPDKEAVKRMTYAGAQEVGNCPRCGAPVYEQPRGFFCSGCE
jgi:DNA topoisomerase-3